MVRIKLVPQLMNEKLEIVKYGNVLLIKGEAFDFSQMNDGDTLPYHAINSEWFVGDVEKINGELTVTIRLPIPTNGYTNEQAFPKDLINVPDGEVVFPMLKEVVYEY